MDQTASFDTQGVPRGGIIVEIFSFFPAESYRRGGMNLVCEFCNEEQLSPANLERHTLAVHGRLGTQNPKANLGTPWVSKEVV